MIDLVTLLQYLIILYQLSLLLGFIALFTAKYFLPKFLQYGKTLQPIPSKKKQELSLLERISNFTVRKSYFAHFYIISAGFSFINITVFPTYSITWLILFHSVRRLYETLYISKYTKDSRMNWSHYAVGIWFYTTLNLLTFHQLYTQRIVPHTINIFAFLVFSLASWDQYENHQTLSRLVKYSLPRGRLFKIVACPHYLDEILIYLSLLSFSMIFIYPLLWVIVSLSISGIETKNYYRSKFKPEKTQKYAILPYIL
ncbi:hypothetical protein TBLA_0J01440 [Henningerozyma blattae CBS 6284]|uniref:Polyprenal reductase n=1 Tax=Henningerozyma blattae (strain ATCC 34711 / CBS 6284 / DSM 70876 / NBRC 10599 / NRRL Y-10934 / UCD 77-7) TaxID=1071380 RepID=I2H9T8_HENB6|nr:hypothetical protein TBLA_0J01440 [Tetrapisispora blattae CBS 6284]CCH63140.1 hypothetical protein TBLA_0J01440 [Tetrapisispora blattae CBS 6284]